jgi:hypothetical protein
LRMSAAPITTSHWAKVVRPMVKDPMQHSN